MRGSWLFSLVWFGGLVFVWAGERVVEPGNTRWVLTGLGVAAVVAATVLRAVRLRRIAGQARAAEAALLGLFTIGLAALLVYFAQSDLPTKVDAQALAQGSPKLATALAVLWPAILVTALFPVFLIELALVAMERAPQLELLRVREALFSGLGIASALVFVFAAQYVVGERDTRWDLSYFRAAKPGEATRRIVAALEEPVSATAFFPPANDVGVQVKAYLDELSRESPKLSVEAFDQAVEPTRARALGVSSNGAVVVSKGSRKETLIIGTELDKARGQLRNLDQELQKRLLVVARSRKTIYLAAGHGERQESPGSSTDQRATLSLLMGELRAQNYELKTLTAAEGLASEIPKDAAAVLVVGPQSAFAPPEVEALKAYFLRGGRLMIALDPESGLDWKELLAPLGLLFTPTALANDQAYFRKSDQRSDRGIIVASQYSAHPAVASNSRSGSPSAMMGAGHLDEPSPKATGLTVEFTLRTHPQTWNDVDGNFAFDPPREIRKAYAVGAAVARKPPAGGKPEEEGRAIVLADSDTMADEVLRASRGNALVVVDGLKWLLGDEAISGATNQETDVSLERTAGRDKAWFWLTVAAAPALVLGVGFFATRRRKGTGAAKEARP